MKSQRLEICTLIIVTSGSALALPLMQPEVVELGDPVNAASHYDANGEWITKASGAVTWSVRGRVNWAPDAYKTDTPWDNQGPPSLDTGPEYEPYGDVLAYTASGVGDVDGDGWGDFAVTWYNADTNLARGEIPNCAPHEDLMDHSGNPQDVEYVGFVRIMSGNPDYMDPIEFDLCNPTPSGQDNIIAGEDNRNSTFNYSPNEPLNSGFNNNARRIGSNFWGFKNKSLWAHEIQGVGDIDGDGRDDIYLSANVYDGDPSGYPAYTGVGEIWSYSNLYNHDPADPTFSWVKIFEIRGDAVHPGNTEPPRMEEFGYQSHNGPIPRNPDPGAFGSNVTTGFDLDFNNDGQQDLLLASKFYRNAAYGHYSGTTGDPWAGRNYAPGAAWIFLLPTRDVFQYIQGLTIPCDLFCNASGLENSPPNGDGISDLVPLKYTTKDFSVRIIGHQGFHSSNGEGPEASPEFYPHHFGHDIDPAGDLDGDDKLDLVVSAPYHMRNHNPANGDYVYSTDDRIGTGGVGGDGTDDLDDNAVGATYIFLSDSDMTRDGSGKSFADLDPKYYIVQKILSIAECGDGGFENMYATRLRARYMGNNQIDFTSEDADFVLSGVEADGKSTADGMPNVFSSIEAGIDLDGDKNPDIVVHNPKMYRADVILNLSSKVQSTIATLGGKPTTMTEIWDSDTGTSSTYTHPIAGGGLTEIEHIDDEGSMGIGGSNRYYTGTTTYKVISVKDVDNNGVNENLYQSPASFRIAGNHDGVTVLGGEADDMELFITCSSGAGNCNVVEGSECGVQSPPLTYQRSAIAVDIVSGPSISVLTEYWPENPELCREPIPSFNVSGIEISEDKLQLWPVWSSPYQRSDGTYEDSKDDALVGVRGFPRRANFYPDADPGRHHDPSDPSDHCFTEVTTWTTLLTYFTGLSDCERNALSVVPAGKAYLVRTP